MEMVKFSNPLGGFVERGIFIELRRTSLFGFWIVQGIDSRKEKEKSGGQVEKKDDDSSEYGKFRGKTKQESDRVGEEAVEEPS